MPILRERIKGGWEPEVARVEVVKDGEPWTERDVEDLMAAEC
jgi:hypothetical protein